MLNSFIWLPVETVSEINKIVVAEKREPYLLLDEMKLEGALQRPFNLFAYEGEQDVLLLSVVYMVSIAQAHAFMQGNKRTGFIAGRNFLQNHGYDLEMPDQEQIAALFIDVIERRISTDELQTQIERYVVDAE